MSRDRLKQNKFESRIKLSTLPDTLNPTRGVNHKLKKQKKKIRKNKELT